RRSEPVHAGWRLDAGDPAWSLDHDPAEDAQNRRPSGARRPRRGRLHAHRPAAGRPDPDLRQAGRRRARPPRPGAAAAPAREPEPVLMRKASAMTLRKLFVVTAAIAALGVAAGAAFAQTAQQKSLVDAAKARGEVGELATGYLAFRTPSSDATLTAAVEAVNA